jgi:hypothetical protein
VCRFGRVHATTKLEVLMVGKQKLELTWIGKEKRLKLELRILVGG